MITAEKVYREIINMPLAEREKLFAVIARRGFEKESYTHEEVFGDISSAPFTLREAAEYLEVSQITVRRWAKEGKIQARRIGHNIVFDPAALRKVKQKKG